MGITPQHHNSKALPEPPPSDGSHSDGQLSSDGEILSDGDEDTNIFGSTAATGFADGYSEVDDSQQPRSLPPYRIPPRRQSLLPSAFDDEIRLAKPVVVNPKKFHSAKRSLGQASIDQTMDNEPHALHSTYSNKSSIDNSLDNTSHAILPSPSQSLLLNQHSRDVSTESTSWLDTIDESGGSSGSSIRSRTSLDAGFEHGRSASADIETEFDAALDAAVEAAYDEGLEPAHDTKSVLVDDVVSNARRNVELAKQKVREAQLESEAAWARDRERRRLQESSQGQYDDLESSYEDNEAEEEERILEEMMADFEFDLQSKSALPQSGSDDHVDKERSDSVRPITPSASNSRTASAANKSNSYDRSFQSPPPMESPPAGLQSNVSTPPFSRLNESPVTNTPYNPSVRVRRLNSQNLTNLSIDTNTSVPTDKEIPRTVPPSFSHPLSPNSKIGNAFSPIRREFREDPSSQNRDPGKAHMALNSLDSTTSPNTPKRTSRERGDDDDATPFPSNIMGRVTSAPDNNTKKNITSPPKVLRSRNMSVSSPTSYLQSPETPNSGTFTISESRKPTTPLLPMLPTPTSGGGGPAYSLLASGGPYLFDNNIHSAMPGSPNMSAPNAPIPLEPCPQSFLLRPFWLMRCLYQTIAHPRGGYLTTKLFIPKDVWRVQNVKLRALEEKISNCDLLTAALLKLAQVDMFDADAVLEEMQSLENILDQVQNIWTKKLGSEVGVQASMSLFKSSNLDEASITSDHFPSSKSSNGTGKSYLSSWRKLRSKSSGTTNTNTATISGVKDSGKDNLVMNSLPMAETPTSQIPQRKPGELQCSGPNANYMNALARLFDAAQVIGKFSFLFFIFFKKNYSSNIFLCGYCLLI